MGCARCGECCIDRTGKLLIGGTAHTDLWLRHTVGEYEITATPLLKEVSWAECRFLLPPNKKGRRLCAIHKSPLRPAACRDFPNIPNAAIPEDCKIGWRRLTFVTKGSKQGRKARSLRSQRAQVRVAPAPPSSLPDPA